MNVKCKVEAFFNACAIVALVVCLLGVGVGLFLMIEPLIHPFAAFIARWAFYAFIGAFVASAVLTPRNINPMKTKTGE